MSILPVKMEEAKNSGSSFFIELYILKLKTGISYIAACDEDICAFGHIFSAVPLSRGEITRNMDSVVNECNIKIGDIDDTKLAYILNGLDFRGCVVEIWRMLYPDSLEDESINQFLFAGYIDTPSYADGVFSCVIKDYFPSLSIPHRSFKMPCNSVFGDECCRMSKTPCTYRIIDVKGNTIFFDSSANMPVNYWKNGTATINGETRNVESNASNSITVHISFIQGGLVGQDITIERGCDKTKENCARYGNLANFSGFPAIPFESYYR